MKSEPEIVVYRSPEVCDFCSSPNIVVAYLIEDFTLPQYGWGSKGGFAACETCKIMIEARDYKALEEHSYRCFFNNYGNFLPRMLVRHFVHDLHMEFWKRLLKI